MQTDLTRGGEKLRGEENDTGNTYQGNLRKEIQVRKGTGRNKTFKIKQGTFDQQGGTQRTCHKNQTIETQQAKMRTLGT